MYEKNPRSRVFAPLAETYRKLGMIDESMKILNVGIKNHPSYTLGYIVLSHCYYDLQNYEMSYNTIRPFVAQNLENITMQKLFAKTCINLGHLEEALQTFKYLLLLNPKDTYVADQIKLLEDDLLVDSSVEEEIVTQNNNSSFDEDEWVQVDFNKAEALSKVDDELEDWNVSKASPLDAFKQQIEANKIAVAEHTLDDDFFHEEYDNEASEVIGHDESLNLANVSKENEEKAEPIITHTLVDLYCSQGHFAKAASILENILELHPDDKVTQSRLDEITMLMIGEIATDSITEEINEEETHIEAEESKIEKIKNLYSSFQDKINDYSNKKLSSI